MKAPRLSRPSRRRVLPLMLLLLMLMLLLLLLKSRQP
jgi:hypothetical protein